MPTVIVGIITVLVGLLGACINCLDQQQPHNLFASLTPFFLFSFFFFFFFFFFLCNWSGNSIRKEGKKKKEQ